MPALSHWHHEFGFYPLTLGGGAAALLAALFGVLALRSPASAQPRLLGFSAALAVPMVAAGSYLFAAYVSVGWFPVLSFAWEAGRSAMARE